MSVVLPVLKLKVFLSVHFKNILEIFHINLCRFRSLTLLQTSFKLDLGIHINYYPCSESEQFAILRIYMQ